MRIDPSVASRIPLGRLFRMLSRPDRRRRGWPMEGMFRLTLKCFWRRVGRIMREIKRGIGPLLKLKKLRSCLQRWLRHNSIEGNGILPFVRWSGFCKCLPGIVFLARVDDFSVVILALVTATVSKVQNTNQQTQSNDEKLWPDPISLWPEYLVIAISALSFSISLGTSLIIVLTAVMVLSIFFIDKFNEMKGRLGLYVNFCINLILFVTWIIAVILFRVNSSSSSIWGFSCSSSIMSNAFVDYDFICTREVPLSVSHLITDRNMGNVNRRCRSRISNPYTLPSNVPTLLYRSICKGRSTADRRYEKVSS